MTHRIITLVLLLAWGSAAALPQRWTLDNVVLEECSAYTQVCHYDGSISGSFVYDAETNTYTQIDITTTPGTTGPAMPGMTYTGNNANSTFGYGSHESIFFEPEALSDESSTGLTLADTIPEGYLCPDGGACQNVLDLVFVEALTDAGGVVPVAPYITKETVNVLTAGPGVFARAAVSGNVISEPGPVQWVLDGVTFEDGTTATGWFYYDANEDNYFNQFIQTQPDVDGLTTHPLYFSVGAEFEIEYTDVPSDQDLLWLWEWTFYDCGGGNNSCNGRDLELHFDAPLTSLGGVVGLAPESQETAHGAYGGTATRSIVSGSIIGTPASELGLLVIEDDRVTHIEGLLVNGVRYDVEFIRGTFEELEPEGHFPFYEDEIATDALIGAIRALVIHNDGVGSFGPHPSADSVVAEVPSRHKSSSSPENPEVYTRYVRGNTTYGGRDLFYDYDAVYASVQQSPEHVDVDVDPWSAENLVKPDTNDSIYVAIMGHDTFDVTDIDPASLELGPGDAPNVAVNALYGNYNGDEFGDVVYTFKTQDTGIVCDATEVELRGAVNSGDPFVGTSTIKTTDCMAWGGFLNVTDVTGGVSAFTAYDLSQCYDSHQAGHGVTVSATLPIGTNPDCDFLLQYQDSTYTAEASSAVPVYDNQSIELSHSVAVVQDNAEPFWLLGGANSGADVAFTLTGATTLDVTVTEVGSPPSDVEISGGDYFSLDLNAGVTRILLQPGDYHLLVATSIGIGGGAPITNSKSLDVRVDVVPAVAEIDVDPWSSSNVVRPDSTDSLYVAILGADNSNGDPIDFVVEQIDPASLKLGAGEAPNIAVTPLYGDYDSDGNNDVAFVFETEETGIFCDDTEVTLRGATIDGDVFEGTGPITTEDCDSGGCHP